MWGGSTRVAIGTGRNSGELVVKRSRPDLAKEAKSSGEEREGKSIIAIRLGELTDSSCVVYRETATATKSEHLEPAGSGGDGIEGEREGEGARYIGGV
jgi:hypothetical protein